MKSLIKYIYYPPLSKHFLTPNNTKFNQIITKDCKSCNKVCDSKLVEKEVKKKPTEYCNIWIRKNF